MIAKDDAIDRVNSWLKGDIADWPITTGDSENPDTLGYALHGVQSCCYAFLAGRYPNYVVAKVTDGTLTFGAKNEGTALGGEWTGLGNTTVKYLGELDSEAAAAGLDLALSCEATLVKGLSDYEGFLEIADYKAKPYVNEAALKTLKDNMASAPSTGAAKYDILVSNSECFQTIYEAKNAYVKSVEAMQTVNDKWDAHAILMEEDDYQAYDSTVNEILYGSMGFFTADEALKAAADILVAYPCYIDLDPTKSKGSLDIVESAPFEYQITADGTRPNIGLNKCMYAPLADGQDILAFEYLCDTELEGGTLFLAHPTLSANDFVDYGKLPAASEWKKAYISVANDLGWGTATDHWMRWDLASSGTFNISVRNMIRMTEEQVKAEGGEIINPGQNIDDVVIDNEVPETFIYNVMGQRVNENAKGLLIKGGKKLFKK